MGTIKVISCVLVHKVLENFIFVRSKSCDFKVLVKIFIKRLPGGGGMGMLDF